METSDIPTSKPSNWRPIVNPYLLAVLGKTGEESCELPAAIFRCIIQGLDEREPKTGKVNRDWLTDEIADVEALTQIAKIRLHLDLEAIAERKQRKIEYKEAWFEDLFVQAQEMNAKIAELRDAIRCGLPSQTMKAAAELLACMDR